MEFSLFSFCGYSSCEVESVNRVTHRCDGGGSGADADRDFSIKDCENHHELCRALFLWQGKTPIWPSLGPAFISHSDCVLLGRKQTERQLLSSSFRPQDR